MTVQAERPCDETIRYLLDRIVSSAIFARSERLRAFFRYVVTKELEGAGQQLKGYTIGIDVFGRPQAFNADSDPLVRVHAGKLRKLLDAYYAGEGRSEKWKIIIPKGTYVPEYHRQVLEYQRQPQDEPWTAASEREAQSVSIPAPSTVEVRSASAPKRPTNKAPAWLPAPLSSPLSLLSVLPLLLLAPLTSPV
ncbi:hypothetical protein P6U16_20015 [Rhizobium sp. 32-5/1]|uniref:hypothetical protein n=1 Tax=Rhizobium sp. 32-5/1 TaxID=3019602 RepID=UPI00240E2976|nr:hypothetical protein [Rhizobium sp. 32-5/1]WEZ83137.1 hypothetical protein P6U16_20015 [Rhizobium sp. 32-5/1]